MLKSEELTVEDIFKRVPSAGTEFFRIITPDRMTGIHHQTREMNNRVLGDMYALENIIFRRLSSCNWNYTHKVRLGGKGQLGERPGGSRRRTSRQMLLRRCIWSSWDWEGGLSGL